MFPPHARGWTRHERYFSASVSVSPACAGMDLAKDIGFRLDGGFPRMRGDGPDLMMMPARVAMFPPHARGWTFSPPREIGAFPPHARGWTLRTVRALQAGVSPACAGMDPTAGRSLASMFRFPRMRGDGPVAAQIATAIEEFPPHARGWTHGRGQ